MKGYIVLFSPTGGTEKVAQILSQEMKTAGFLDEIVKVDLCDRNFDFKSVDIKAEDFALIAVPSYGGRVPALAAERLALVKGNGARAVLVCVYGNRDFDDTLVELQDIAHACGFVSTAAISAVARHSIANQYGAGRPDDADVQVLKEYAGRIMGKVREGYGSDLHIIGNRPYKKGMDMHLAPKAGNKCTECGLCADVCPAGAIDKNSIRNTDKQKCISCMRCVAVCPHKARDINGVLKFLVPLALKKSCKERKQNQLFI